MDGRRDTTRRRRSSNRRSAHRVGAAETIVLRARRTTTRTRLNPHAALVPLKLRTTPPPAGYIRVSTVLFNEVLPSSATPPSLSARQSRLPRATTAGATPVRATRSARDTMSEEYCLNAAMSNPASARLSGIDGV